MKNYIKTVAGLFIVNSLSVIVGTTKHAVEVGNGWYEARLITPRTQYYVKKAGTFTLEQPSASVVLHQYKEKPSAKASSRSHIIVKDSTFSGASIDTVIRTMTKRKDEKKTTFVQYDKDNVQQNGKDFCVDATYLSSKGIQKCNYDGGHLIDHKFSAQGSHTDRYNYVPQLYYYNRWIKENIVKDLDGYLELPLFTPNPPTIKVKDEARSDPIPIGILLVSLNASQISDMYYFPNNQYNYRTCQHNFKMKASEIKSLFKIKKAFHKLLWPAIIYDIQAGGDEALASQLARETKVMSVVSDLIDGMSVTDLDEEDEVLSTLASSIIHQPIFEFSLVLATPKKKIKKLTQGQPNPESLRESFNSFGSFLIEYSMKNALKSELLSIHSRIMFLNLITAFIECSWDSNVVNPQAVKWIDNAYSDIYQQTIESLFAVKEKMKLEDLIYFTNFFKKLSSSFIYPAFYSPLKVCKNMTIGNIPGLVTLLTLLHEKTTTEVPNETQKQNLINLFIEAEDNIIYVMDAYAGFEYPDEIAFLKSSRERLLEWCTTCEASGGTYQDSPNSSQTFRYARDYILNRLINIGKDISSEEESDVEDESSIDESSDN